MKELVRVFSQIALSRQGPQDLPASTVLLGLTVLAYMLVNFLIGLALPPVEGPWFVHVLVDAGFTLVWYAVLLRLFRKQERFLQTSTAMFGYQLVLSPLSIAAIYLSRRFADNDVLLFPATIIGLALAIWIIRAGGHILKAALELPMPACVALVIMQILAGQLLLVALLPESPP